MNIRMKDIAKDLGVSMITISKVLRNHPDIGQETRERVLARGERVGLLSELRCPQPGGGRLRPLFPEKRFPRRLMTRQFACRTQITGVLYARPAEAFGSGRFLQSMQLDLSLRDMFHLV